MIIPEYRSEAGRRGLSVVITAVLCGLAYLGMILGDVSIESTSRAVYREVDLTDFKPFMPAPEPQQMESEATEDAPEPAAEEDLELTVSQLDQLDMSQLFSDELDVAVATTPQPSRGAEDAGNPSTEIETANDGLAGLGSLDGLDAFGGDNLSPRRGRNGTAQTGINTGIELSGGTQAVAGSGGAIDAGGGAVVGSNQARAETAAGEGQAIQRLSLEAFGDDYANLETHALINWMKANPGTLPVGIRQLVRYQPTFLSSVTSFTVGGVEYELYLMCKENLYEVHIVLVEGENSTYLVDRSFQRLSTYLREGAVRRAAPEGIVAVSSQRDAASSERSTEFYSLFLSWWEEAKKEVE